MNKQIALRLSNFLLEGMERAKIGRGEFQIRSGLRSLTTLTLLLDCKARLPLDLVGPISRVLHLDPFQERELLILALAQECPTSFIEYLEDQLVPVYSDAEDVGDEPPPVVSEKHEQLEQGNPAQTLRIEVNINLHIPGGPHQ